MAPLDERLFRDGTYFRDDHQHMYEVRHVRVTGNYPQRQRTVSIQNIITGNVLTMTEADLRKTKWIIVREANPAMRVLTDDEQRLSCPEPLLHPPVAV